MCGNARAGEGRKGEILRAVLVWGKRTYQGQLAHMQSLLINIPLAGSRNDANALALLVIFGTWKAPTITHLPREDHKRSLLFSTSATSTIPIPPWLDTMLQSYCC